MPDPMILTRERYRIGTRVEAIPRGWNGPEGFSNFLTAMRHSPGFPEDRLTVYVLPSMVASWKLPDAPYANGSELGPWSTYVHQPRVIDVCLVPWLRHGGQKQWPLFADILDDIESGKVAGMQYRLNRWEALTGSPYHGSAGVAGITILRDSYARRNAQRNKQPLWTHPELPGDAATAYEAEIHGWQSQLPTDAARVNVTFDRLKSYLASTSAAEVAWGCLKHHGSKMTFNGAMAGWWKIRTDEWRLPEFMPSPLGQSVPKNGTLWVTTPTLRFWDYLSELGFTSGYDIVDAYLAPGKRLLRPWAQTMRDALNVCEAPHTSASGPHFKALAATAADTYHATVGMFSHEGGRVYRPDWRATIVAQDRATVLSTAWRIGRSHDLWPVRVDVDSLTYPHPPNMSASAFGDSIGLHNKGGLGSWRAKV